MYPQYKHLNQHLAAPGGLPAGANTSVLVLALMMFLVPALGVPNELMLQDTLKSAVVAFGVLIATLMFFWQQRNRSEPLLWHGMLWLPVTLFVYALGSMAWSHTYLAGVEAVRWFLLTLLMWLGLNTFQSNNLPKLVWGVHCGVTVASAWAVFQFLTTWSLFPQGPLPASTFFNRNFFAEYAVCAWPLSAWLLAQLRRSQAVPWMAFSMALNTVALLMTGTRSALIAFVFVVPASLVMFIKYRRNLAIIGWTTFQKWSASLLFVLGVILLGNIPSTNPQVIDEGAGITALQRSFLRTVSIGAASEYTEGSFSVRSLMWKATARMLIAHPMSGVGAGAWEVEIPEFQRAGTLRETDYYAHNDFLQLLAEYGLVAGGLSLAFFFAYWILSVQKTLSLPAGSAHAGPLRVASLISLLAFVLVGNAGFPLHLAGSGALFALNMSLLMSSDSRLGYKASSLVRGIAWRPAWSKAALICSVLFMAVATVITQKAVLVESKLVQCLIALSSHTAFGKVDVVTDADLAVLLQGVREAVSIDPHYRKLTPSIADQLAARGRWADAAWIWESVITSRPKVPAFWFNLATAYLKLGRYADCQIALDQLQALQPDAIGSSALQAILFSRTGQMGQATLLVTEHFRRGDYDYDLLDAGYVIGLASKNWELAIQSLELRKAAVPSQSVDVDLKMGNIYATPDTTAYDEAKALASFQSGLQAISASQIAQYRAQVPEYFRSKLASGP